MVRCAASGQTGGGSVTTGTAAGTHITVPAHETGDVRSGGQTPAAGETAILLHPPLSF